MTIQIWQIAQARRVLNAFCAQNNLALDDATAVEAGNHLLRLMEDGIDQDGALFHKLGDALSNEPDPHRENNAMRTPSKDALAL